MEQQPEAFASAAALRVLLKHLAGGGQQQNERRLLEVCCRLLCCSRGMASLLHSTCRGRLRASAQRQPAERPQTASEREAAADFGKALGGWLAQHGELLQSLELTLWPESEAVVAAGLTAAAAASSSGALPLESLRCLSASTSGQLLCALASSCAQNLKHLALHLQLQEVPAAAAQQHTAALASLTTLDSLELAGSWCNSQPLKPVLGPALPHLTRLTQLLLPRVLLDPDSAQLLPTSLVELHVCCHDKPLQLQGLSALRRLHLGQALLPQDGLPASLTRLRLGRCESDMSPLLALPELQWLRVDFNLTAAQLQDLATLTQLQEVQLTLFSQQGCCAPSCSNCPVAAAVSRLSAVPLKQLKLVGQLGSDRLPVAVLRQLGSLTQLTRLSAQELTVDGTPQHLATQLLQLTALQQLELLSLQWSGEQPQPQPQPQQLLTPLVQAVRDMTRLRGLTLAGMMLEGTAAAAITAQLQSEATHLTALRVGVESLDGDDFSQ